ncbi:MotA/TolQ/ExbB proton channel family protein [Marinobacter salicampi]|uniref:MotA/TolQ/ExbB proton channel family protein n=1 Tax=Marinobacter salicampi TaxID=435907 RepID=UPI00140D39AC|nr:MotA/TolQ/ExbB proton channel family protein [Marinobacter salicampi]
MSETSFTGAPENLLAPVHQLIEMGGPVMLVLIALAVVGLITFFYLVLADILFAPRFSADVRKAVAGWHEAPDKRWPGRVEPNKSGLGRGNPLRPLLAFAMNARLSGKEPSALREELARRSHKLLQPFEAPLKIIEVIAALAPLLGLLGTVMGMMEAFNAMAATEGRANASQLSGGIYEALTTTAAGLVLAIPFAALAAWVEFRLRRINSRLNDALVQIVSVELPGQGTASAPEARETTAEQYASHPRMAHVAG